MQDQLLAAGAELRRCRNGHLFYRLPNGSSVVLPSTPSGDFRAVRNARAAVRRALNTERGSNMSESGAGQGLARQQREQERRLQQAEQLLELVGEPRPRTVEELLDRLGATEVQVPATTRRVKVVHG